MILSLSYIINFCPLLNHLQSFSPILKTFSLTHSPHQPPSHFFGAKWQESYILAIFTFSLMDFLLNPLQSSCHPTTPLKVVLSSDDSIYFPFWQIPQQNYQYSLSPISFLPFPLKPILTSITFVVKSIGQLSFYLACQHHITQLNTFLYTFGFQRTAHFQIPSYFTGLSLVSYWFFLFSLTL